ncbi:MAG: M23 family metallopeptidase, partial [Pseudanabaena sp.]
MRKSTISTLTLATLLCLSTNNYFLVGSAYAATKSAISPDIAVSKPSEQPPQVQPQPKIAPVPPTIEIHERTNAAPANQPVTNAGNRESVQVNSVQVNIESVTPSPKAAAKRSQPVGQPVEIVLENRSTGCKFKASSLLERNADLCNPEAIVSKNNSQKYYQNGSVLHAAASGDTSVQVRRLTEQEIAAMSLPSNGDKQMLFPLITQSVISSMFGTRVHPITGQVRFHQGTDLAAPEGTP